MVWDESSIPFLKTQIAKYPFWAHPHILLAALQNKVPDIQAKKAINKAAIFVPDSFFLHTVLTEYPDPVFAELPQEAVKQKEEVNLLDNTDDEKAIQSADVGKKSNDPPAVDNPLPNLAKAQPKEETTTPIAVEGLVFEPFHTVDYFASQGIKIKAEDAGTDKLSKQLKSFSAWLREMKSIAPKAAEQKNDTVVDALASQSISSTDVVTESMADVWLKQGDKQKAIEIYKKLSLRNPAKSSYFAALIEQIKL